MSPALQILYQLSHCCSHMFWETNSLRRTMQIVECSLLHWRGQGRASLSQGLWPTSVKTLYTLRVVLKPTSPNSLNLAWKMSKGDTIRLQAWFIIRRVSWLYTAAYTSGCRQDYKGDWPYRGSLHSFWRQEISVWNLVFISLGGQFGVGMLSPWLPGTWSKAHWKCKMDFPSFSRWSQLGLFLSSFNFIFVVCSQIHRTSL